MGLATHTGVANIPPFKINGTNADLQLFESECKRLGLEVSKANGYFRDDYEHCLIPAYAYHPTHPDNVKLQLLSSDVYYPELTFNLPGDWDAALAMVEVINEVAVLA